MHAGPYATTARIDQLGAKSIARAVQALYPGAREYFDTRAIVRDALRVHAYARGVLPLQAVEHELARFVALPHLARHPRLALVARCGTARKRMDEGRPMTIRDISELAGLCPRYVRKRGMLEQVPVVSDSRPRRYQAEGCREWLEQRLQKGARH